MNSPSRFFSLWMILVLAVGVVAEIGAATGLIPPGVLDGLARRPADWWLAPRWLHGVQASLLALLAVWTSALLFLPAKERPTRFAGGLAAVFLASHFSPLHAGIPYAPLVGTLIALALLTWLLRGREIPADPRRLLRSLRSGLGAKFRAARLADVALWSLAGAVVVYALATQFGEAARVVSQETDFGTFYDAAIAVRGGSDPYEATAGKYFYPPTFAFCFAVLTVLPKGGASLLWFTIKLALVIWSLAAVYGLLEERAGSAAGRRWLAAGVVLVAARFLLADLRFGNVNTFVLWLTLAAIALDFKEKPVLAGLAAAAAVSIKLVPAVFLVYFLARGRCRVVLWAGAWLVALNLLPLAAMGHSFGGVWASYMETGVYGKLAGRIAQPDNQSLWGALNRSLDLPLSQIRIIWGAASVLLTAVAAWTAWRVRGDARVRRAGAAALFFLLGLLVSPGSWVVHYGAVLLPMSYLLAVGVMGRRRDYAYWAVFAAASLAFTFSGWWRLTVRLSIEQSWFVAANCLLFFVLVFLVSDKRPAGDRSRDLTLGSRA